jgi:heme o synthase
MTTEPFDHGDSGAAACTAAVRIPPPLSWPLPAFLRMRLADYCILGKVRISLLVLVVTAIGFCLGSKGPVDLALLVHTLLGTGLVAIAANTLNQYMERQFDRLMVRTADRPIPAGRLTANEALTFGAVCAVVGLIYMILTVNRWATTLAAATLILYLFAYTPLKRRTVLNTWVGALPGALPPMIGFAAAHGRLNALAWTLFAILFVWQLPHFFAIAWMYREDYARGGYRMLSVADPSGTATRRQSVALCVVMLVVSLAPSLLGYAGAYALVGAVILGVAWLAVAVRMARRLNDANARLMLLASVVYLPALMMLLLLDRMVPLAVSH